MPKAGLDNTLLLSGHHTIPDHLSKVKIMLYVCPLNHVKQIVRQYSITHLITLVSTKDDIPFVQEIDTDRHLKFCFNDINEAHIYLKLPQISHVERLIRFIGDWEKSSPMLIHCWAGISRSTAAAFIAVCMHNPEIDETEIALALRKASPTAMPNKRIIGYGDELLGRKGRMIKAVEKIGQGRPASTGCPFQVPFFYPKKSCLPEEPLFSS